MSPISLLFVVSHLFLLAYGSIPRPSIGHSSLNITLGESAKVWASVSEQAFVEFWLVAQHPNGTYEIASGISSTVVIRHNTSITQDGVLVTSNIRNGTTCAGVGQSAYLGVIFKPRQAGNYSLIPYFLYYFHDGPETYRYPNSSVACIDTPVKVEAAAAPRLSLLVKAAAPGATPTQTPEPTTPMWLGYPITEVTLSPEPTGDAFHLPISRALATRRPSACLFGALVLSIVFL